MSSIEDDFAEVSYLTDEEIAFLEELLDNQHKFKSALDWSLETIKSFSERIELLETRISKISLAANKGELAWGMQQPLGGLRADA